VQRHQFAGALDAWAIGFGLRAIVIEDKQPDGGRQIAMATLGIDHCNELGQS
jgi:hypothetical protein